MAGHALYCPDQMGLGLRTSEQAVCAFCGMSSTRTHSSLSRLSDQETVVLGIIVLLIRVRTSVVQMKELKGAGTAG